MIDLFLFCEDLKNPNSQCRQDSNNIISKVYYSLKNPSEKTMDFLKEWQKDFRYIYGDVNTNLSSNSKLNIPLLFENYNIESSANKSAEETQILFFSIQTYFSILMKYIMRYILKHFNNTAVYSYEDILLGQFAKDCNITNYCYTDWYCWPLFELSNNFNIIMDEINNLVMRYEVKTPVDDFVLNNNYDYIKQMYEAVIPKELRHALGEYYTPDWLAEKTIINSINSGDFTNINDVSFIDPTCGSGTFLFKTIALKRKSNAPLDNILSTVKGIDINPLAILTAKTNYILSILDMLDGNLQISIPVYNTDIITLATNQHIKLINPTKNECDIVRNNFYNDMISVGNFDKADIIIGNPPWVNWEYMPEQYRQNSQHLWIDYKLFSATGRDLSFSKEDISVLITYIVMDKLLKDNGIIGFVIRQGVFKSAQNGVAFRKFTICDKTPIKVIQVDDLSKIRAFENATNSTALFYAQKGQQTTYPVKYNLWKKREDLSRFSFSTYSKLNEVMSQISIDELVAKPAVEEDITSIWITTFPENLSLMENILGTNNYRARTGIFTGGANAVYWLDVDGKEGNLISISNIIERAKRKVEPIHANIEPTYIFPMLKGSNVKQWNITYDTYLLCPHTSETKMWPVSQAELKETAPKTLEYLEYFKDDLDNRNGFAGWEKEIQKQEFHAILRVGDYTFSKYKVIWKYIASEFICAVISTVDDPYLGDKLILPNEKIMYVSMDDEMEAYYLCGMLSSSIIAECVKSYMNPTSISTHVLNKLNIPNFDSTNPVHIEIAQTCKEGHGKKDISPYISKLDKLVSQIYKI